MPPIGKFSHSLIASIILASTTPLNSGEVRIGALRHDVRSGLKQRYEKGTDIQAEYLTNTFDNAFFKFIFDPRLHAGVNINTHHATNVVYAGLTWHLDLGTLFFLEASLGGGHHDGNRKKKTKHKNALGSRLLFRESISFGVQFTKEQSLSIVAEHMSNAKMAKPNPGLTNVGIRWGYRF